MNQNVVRTNRRKFLTLTAGMFSAASLVAAETASALRVFRKQGFALGTTVTLAAVSAEKEQAEVAFSAAFAELERVEQAMSLFRPDSELARLNQNAGLENPSALLVTVLREAARVSKASSGAFDVTVQPLWELRQRAHRRKQVVEESVLQTARALVDWRDVEISGERVQLRRPGAAITLNGIAQGFAADLALAAMVRHGVRGALLDTGEFSARGANADGRAWRVGIQHPREREHMVSLADLKDRCLATSGDYETPFRNDFLEHHVFDPRTGHSPTELASVSVAAPTAMLADALSTTLMVAGVTSGIELLRSFPETDALFVRKDASIVRTPGFPATV